MTRVAFALALLIAASGCGYQLGYEPVADVQDVAVPIFENKTLRRGVEYDLTREVRRIVLETTPLHLGREGSSRAILRGSIVSITESVLIPGPNEQILESGLSITIEVMVVERGTGKILVGRDTDGDGRPDAPIVLTDSENYVPPNGGTRDTATARAVKDLAERTVQLLERRWGGAQGE